MQKKIMWRAVLVGLLCVVISGSVVFAQSAEDDVFAVIKLSNLETFIPSVGQFIDKFQPGMGGMVNPMMVGNMVFKNANWTGMDMAGEYMAVVLNPMKYPQAPFALVVPITSRDEYLGALAQSMTQGEETDGISAFMQPNQKNMYVAFAGDNAVLSEDSSVAAQAKMLIENDSAALSEVPAVRGQLAAFLSINKILATTRPMLDMFKQQMFMSMEQVEEGEEAAPAGVQDMLQQEVDMLLGLLDQTDRLQIGIGLEDGGLRLSKAVFASSDSAMETFMAAQMPQASRLLGLMPQDAALLGSGKLTLTPEFIDGYVGFIKAMSAMGEATDQAMLEKMAVWARQAMEVFAGDFAFSGLSQDEDSLFTQVYAVTDSAKAKEVIAQYPEILQEMSGMYEEMGVEMKISLADTSEFKSGEILTYNFGMNADMIPDPEGQAVFNTLFGEDIKMPAGFIGDYGVFGFGKNPQAQVENVMELLDSGADVAAQYTPAMFDLPEENNIFMYISVPKIMTWAAKIVPDAPQFEIVEGPGMATTARFIDSHFEGEMFLPIDELLAIKTMAEQAEGEASAE